MAASDLLLSLSVASTPRTLGEFCHSCALPSVVGYDIVAGDGTVVAHVKVCEVHQGVVP